MPAPKTPDRIRSKPSKSRMRKLECFECGCIIYASRSAIGKHGTPSCACGASFYFSTLEDCEAVQGSEYVETHPLYLDELERERRAAMAEGKAHGIPCNYCDHPLPVGADMGNVICVRCKRHNTFLADGDRVTQSLRDRSSGTYEAATYVEHPFRDDAPVPIRFPRNRRIPVSPARIPVAVPVSGGDAEIPF